jgi:hypothetical protein
MRVTDLEPAEFVKVTAAGAVPVKIAPPAPPRNEERPVPKVRVSEPAAAPAPRVSVVSSGEDPKGGPTR